MAVRIVEMIETRTEVASELVTGLDLHLEEIAAGYEEFCASMLEEGEEPFDVRRQLVLFRRKLVHHREALQSLDLSVVDQTHDTDAVRADVRRLTDAVILNLSQVRDNCKSLYGEAGLDRAFLAGRFPRRPSRLFKRGTLVQQSLRKSDPGLELLRQLPEGVVPITPQQLADWLDPELAELGRLVEDWRRENKAFDDARARRRDTIRDFDRDVGAIGRMMQGILRAADLRDLTALFLVSRRRNRRRSPPEGEESPAAEAAEAPANESPSTGEGAVDETTPSGEGTIDDPTAS